MILTETPLALLKVTASTWVPSANLPKGARVACAAWAGSAKRLAVSAVTGKRPRNVLPIARPFEFMVLQYYSAKGPAKAIAARARRAASPRYPCRDNLSEYILGHAA